jgi:hypothetical protein
MADLVGGLGSGPWSVALCSSEHLSPNLESNGSPLPMPNTAAIRSADSRDWLLKQLKSQQPELYFPPSWSVTAGQQLLRNP